MKQIDWSHTVKIFWGLSLLLGIAFSFYTIKYYVLRLKRRKTIVLSYLASALIHCWLASLILQAVLIDRLIIFAVPFLLLPVPTVGLVWDLLTLRSPSRRTYAVRSIVEVVFISPIWWNVLMYVASSLQIGIIDL